ncbi:LacI family DNA-binding transcriptional regulator [Loktanella sp. SALINAS62]|uniref:LacI family DNA-binding transcriptional regulator n=1 Tax=Loktanella sp. SALINAS62 TaxID=2706124 RepID=UPI001B8AED1E|nr:LacI family DNA-binding transcriptional regulator [Loktanella sp. SALINAS62]MBS1303381.1 LacI family transcriptional regulator [Loktanella sp. SALINAS62]
MREVARRANVSVATVSRALRSPGQVSSATIQKVRSAAEDLGYVYNVTASDILKGRSTVVGLVVPTSSSTLFGETIHGVQDVTAETGFSVIQGATRYDAVTEEALIDSLLERHVHALILTGMTYANEDRIRRLARDGWTRVVVVWEKPGSDPGISYVGIDNRSAAERMTEHLIALGHRRIGLIVGPYSRQARVRHRLEGYRDALEKAGIAFDPDIVMERRPDLLEGREAMDSLMGMEVRPTAVFAASDLLAIGALKAARLRGLSVPGDVSIAGFDDMNFGAYQDPPITTVRVEAYRIGQLAGQIAVEPIGTPERSYCLDCDLVIRSSTGPIKTTP